MVAAKDEERERGGVVPDRRVGLAGTELSAQRAASSAASQSPASSSAFIAPIGRPQLPAGASAMLSR